MGNQGCKACDFVQDTNQLRKQNIDPALLKPIQFSDPGTDRPESQDPHSKQDRKQGSTQSALAGDDNSYKINIRHIPPPNHEVVLQPNEEIHELDLQSRASKLQEGQFQGEIKEIKVPFPVIKLIIKPRILEQFKKIEKEFEKNFNTPTAHSYHTWRMQNNGIYTNNIPDGTTVILTEKFLYKGWTKINEFVPQSLGLLIKQEGRYQGNFLEGLAHGKGIYSSWDGCKRFSGKWNRGELIEGKIQTQNYIYEGQLENSIPNGSGQLIVVDIKGYELFRYTGDFKDGKFQGSGKYECTNYVYTGQFREGKKNGLGVVMERYRTQKKRKKNENLINGAKKQGEWKDDKMIRIKEK